MSDVPVREPSAPMGAGVAAVNRRVPPWTGVGAVFAPCFAGVVITAAVRG